MTTLIIALALLIAAPVVVVMYRRICRDEEE